VVSYDNPAAGNTSENEQKMPPKVAGGGAGELPTAYYMGRIGADGRNA